jgi:NitT/TauT family transport system substrate-binding protein
LGSAALAITVAITVCSGAAQTAGPNSGPQNLEAVTYLTAFNTFGRESYAYVALKKGYFKEAGFNVTIQPGTGSVDVMKLLASGSADYGIVDFSAAAITIANQSLPVTAVAAITQATLSAIVTLDRSGIKSPSDLAGKSIGDQPGSTVGVSFRAYAKAAGIDPDSVKFVPALPPALPQLLASGQVDAIGQFVVGEPLIAAVANGRNVIVLPFGDLLPELYGTALMTSTKLASKNPEQVRRFSKALLRGLVYAAGHPEEAAEILASYQPTQNKAIARKEVELLAPYVGAGDKVGTLDRERVVQSIKILAAAIKKPITPEEIVSFDLVPGSSGR